MLKIRIPGVEFYDDVNEEFITSDEVVLELEHSLVSLSKWESVFEKPFLKDEEKTTEEVLAYIAAMVLTPEFPPDVLSRLTEANFQEIKDYIDAKRSATWFSDDPHAPRQRQVVTSELIYSWLISYQIPFEVQHWHLNRLLTLIKICNHQNQPPKKMSKAEIAARNRELNAKRLAEMGTRG